MTYLWVSLYSLCCLFLSLVLPSSELALQRFLLLLLYLSAVRSTFVVFHSFCTDIGAFAVFFHCKICLRFAEVRTDELGILLDRNVAIAYGAWKSHQLDQRRGAIGVASRILWSSFCHFCVCFDSAGPVSFLKLLITKFSCLVGLLRIDIGILLCLYLCLLSCTKLVENVWGTMFGQ